MNRLQQSTAILLLTAAIVMLVVWIISGALQASLILQTWVPSHAAKPHGAPWINLGSHHETKSSGH